MADPISFHPGFWSDVRRCEASYGKGWLPSFLIDLRDVLLMGIERHAPKDRGYGGPGAVYVWRWSDGAGVPLIEVRVKVDPAPKRLWRVLGAYEAGLDVSGVGGDTFFAARLP